MTDDRPLQPGVLDHALEGFDMAKGPFRYAWFNTQFWKHRTVKSLSRDARELYFYLITGPSTNMAGMYYLPWPLAKHELHHTPWDTLSHAVSELKERGRILYDDDADIVLVIDHLEHNTPDSSKVAKGIVNVVKELPANSLIGAFVEAAKRHQPQYTAIWDTLITGEDETLSDTLPDTLSQGVYQGVHHTSEQRTENSKQRTERETRGAIAPANSPPVDLSAQREVAATVEKPGGKNYWTADQKALVDLLWQWLKAKDALPASASAKGGGRWFPAQMTEAGKLLFVRSFDEWAACFQWATDEPYWREHLTGLRQLGDKVWPQYARHTGKGGGAAGDRGSRRGPSKGPNGGGALSSLME